MSRYGIPTGLVEVGGSTREGRTVLATLPATVTRVQRNGVVHAVIKHGQERREVSFDPEFVRVVTPYGLECGGEAKARREHATAPRRSGWHN